MSWFQRVFNLINLAYLDSTVALAIVMLLGIACLCLLEDAEGDGSNE